MSQSATRDANARPGIARATVFGFVAEATVFPAGLVTAAFLTRYLGVSDYGRLSLVYAVISPVVWLASATFAGRVGVSLLTEAQDWNATAASLLRANILLGIGAMLGFCALVPWLAAGLGSPDLAPLLWVAAVEIGLMPVARIHRDALIAKGRYSGPALATLVFQLARVALVLVLVSAGWSLLGAILANLGARALELMVYRTRVRVPIRGAVPGWLDGARAQIGTIFGYALCLQLFSRVDLLMLSVLRAPADDIGLYGAAQNVAQAPGLLAFVLSPLVIAALRRAELANAPGEVAALKSGSARIALAIWALAGPAAAGAPQLVGLLFGPSFASSGPILGWLGIGGGAGLVLSVLAAHQVAGGRFARPLVAAIPMLLAALALQAAWIPRYGALGAAWATAAAAILAAMIAQVFDGFHHLSARTLDLARMVGGATAGYLSTQVAARAGIPSPIDILVGALVTGTILIAVRLASVREVRQLLAQFIGFTPNRRTA